ncbi:GspE/PulE family protein [Rubritalea marina]|uniref:GspE/PulE family protein n=1 Tax=Rubritalea marina TaxID=361055 RepID=UPI0003747455|nr:ATPase, T2SS/T4P/T4SS family [Rubritalea marina]
MIDFDGFQFNDLISKQIMQALGEHDQAFAEITHDQVQNRVTKSVFMACLAKMNGLAFFPKVAEFCDSELLDKCDPSTLTRGNFTPLCIHHQTLLIAVVDPWQSQADEYLASRFPGHEIVRIVTIKSEISRTIENASASAGPNQEQLESIEVEDFEEFKKDFDVTNTEYDEPMAALTAQIMSDAVKKRTSDIHFKVEKESFYYAFRINGDIAPRVELPMKLKDRIDAFLLNLMGLPPEIRSTAIGISGRFTISYFHRPIDIRYERHRTYRGYHITMRLLDKGNLNVTLGKGTLAFDDETLFAMRKVMKVPAGIIVMSGPTGSGKSTTLNAMLRELNRPEVNILTLENPVEDEVPGITHCDLRSADEFKPMVSSFMRSDPDIILMGEVRDIESAELAIEAAVTGHKVLTTVHTARASQIIERFEQLGIERWKIAQTLKAACAQRLLKVLCPYCKVELEGVSEYDRKTYNLDDSWTTQVIYERNQDGCQECNSSGYAGRTAIVEIIPITPKISDQLSKGEISPYDLEIQIEAEGILPNLRRSGLKLLKSGKTDLDAVSKVIDMSSDDH